MSVGWSTILRMAHAAVIGSGVSDHRGLSHAAGRAACRPMKLSLGRLTGEVTGAVGFILGLCGMTAAEMLLRWARRWRDKAQPPLPSR